MSMDDKEKSSLAWELSNKISRGEMSIPDAMIQVMEHVVILENAKPGMDKDAKVIAKCRKELMLTVCNLLRQTMDPAAITVALGSVVATLAAVSTDPMTVANGMHEQVMAKLDTPERKALTDVMLALLAAIQAKVAVGKLG